MLALENISFAGGICWICQLKKVAVTCIDKRLSILVAHQSIHSCAHMLINVELNF